MVQILAAKWRRLLVPRDRILMLCSEPKAMWGRQSAGRVLANPFMLWRWHVYSDVDVHHVELNSGSHDTEKSDCFQGIDVKTSRLRFGILACRT